MMDVAKQKLLAYSYQPARTSDKDDAEWDEALVSSERKFVFLTVKGIAAHLAFALLYVLGLTIVVTSFWSKAHGDRPHLIYTPARDHIRYKIGEPLGMLPNNYHDDSFFGDPSIELDQRWDVRLKHATIRLSEDEFRRYNQTGVKLGDDSGYLATPTAYHDLHCLRALHKAMYPDYYFPGEDIAARSEHGQHWRHCLHNLASATMCNVDMTIRVMVWHPKSEWPSPVDHEHECVDWDVIDAWAGERYVDTSIPGLVVHP